MRNTLCTLVLLCVAGSGTAMCQTLEFFGSEISTPVNIAGVTQGVVVGDFNGDGKPDLALVTSGGFLQLQPTIIAILLGNGDGTFRKGGVYTTTGTNSQTVVVGDFNGDGKQDLVVPNFGGIFLPPDISVLLGNGDGTFQPATSVPLGGKYPCTWLAAGDFNKDGKLDLAATSGSASNQVDVLLGNGDGTFQTPVPYAAGTGSSWIGAADFNGDGKMDLVTTDYNTGTILVLLGNGDGTFQVQASIPVGAGISYGVVGDFNGDGKADLAISGGFSGNVSVLVGKGDGTFQAPKNYAVGSDLQSIAMADFDGDGKIDLAVIDSGASTEAQSMAVLRGNGDGTFQTPPLHFDVKSPYQAAVGDFNKDGKTDLAVANNFGDSVVDVDVLRNTTYTGAPAAIISHLANGALWSTTILLVNADQRPASYQVNFHSEKDGSPLALPLLAYGPQSSVTGSIAPGELAVIQTDGSGSTLLEGWAELVTPNAIGGTGIFTDRAAVGNSQEAAVPLNSSAGTKLFIPFDETSGSVVFATGIALANTGASQANVTAAFLDDAGNPISTAAGPIAIAAGGHIAFVVNDKFPEVKGKRGTVAFTSNVPIYGLGIRYNGTAFTSIGALSNVPSGNKIISHLANGGGPATGGQWSTTILLVNADVHPATYQVNFHSEKDGSPLVLPLLKYGPQSSVTGSLAPGELAVIQTDGSGSTLFEGWAEVVTQDAIGGTGIFTDQSGSKRQEAAVPLNSKGGTKLFIPFDETSGSIKFATGIALANTGAGPATVVAAFLDDAGNQISTATTQIIIPAGAHTAFVVTDKFPEVKGKRGTVLFASNVAIYGLGIRYNGTAFTSIGAILP
jgi:VCBS repeat protein